MFFVEAHLSESARFCCSACTSTLYYHSDDSVLFFSNPSCSILSLSPSPSHPLIPSPASISTALSFITFLSRPILRLLCHPLATPLRFPHRLWPCGCSHSLLIQPHQLTFFNTKKYCWKYIIYVFKTYLNHSVVLAKHLSSLTSTQSNERLTLGVGV